MVAHLDKWKNAARATESDIAGIEALFGVTLPESYKRFMVEFGSGEGLIDEAYIVLDSVSEIVKVDEEHRHAFRKHGLLLFGGDAGGEAFAFDLRASPCTIVMVGFISDYDKDRITLGSEMSDLFDYPNRFS